jgi:folylpolyglutamate synthase/dihydropteroate synthase
LDVLKNIFLDVQAEYAAVKFVNRTMNNQYTDLKHQLIVTMQYNKELVKKIRQLKDMLADVVVYLKATEGELTPEQKTLLDRLTI